MFIYSELIGETGRPPGLISISLESAFGARNNNIFDGMRHLYTEFSVYKCLCLTSLVHKCHTSYI